MNNNNNNNAIIIVIIIIIISIIIIIIIISGLGHRTALRVRRFYDYPKYCLNP